MYNVKTVIKPQTNLLRLDLPEIWRFRELFFIFAWRDIKVRYKQTILGVTWVVLQPLISTFIFTVFFGRMAKVPSGDLPYPLFVLIGLVFWGFFSGSLNTASNSLVSNEHIIKKVYFPRIILPLAAIITNSVDFLVNLVLLLILGLFFGFLPSLATIPLILLAMFFTAISAAGISLFFSAFNVRYRDVRYILPFIFQTLMFLAPVIYPLSIVDPKNQLLMAINPMTSVIEIVRQVFSNNLNLDFRLIGISLISTIVLSSIGIYYFKKTEYQFADIA